MEREHGYFNGERQEDQQEGQQLPAPAEDRADAAQEVRGKVQHTGCVAAQLEVQQQDTGQHKNTAEKGIQQEFPGRVDASRHAMLQSIVAPDADKQEHGGQFDFPEKEEEQQVERHKDAHHTRFQQQQESHVFFNAHLFPAADDGKHGEQRVKNDH